MNELGNEYAPVVDRHKSIIRTSIVGIITNVLLAAFKAFIGIVSNSIAITLDAVNNLSDALSSVITILGTVIAGKKPDAKHPLGYGRTEYLTSTIIAVLVMYAGVTALIESVKKIIHPEAADYSVVSLVIIAVAVVVKIILGQYVKSQGKKVNSGALEASGADAMFDAVLSFSVLVSAVIFMVLHISLEAYVGVVIAIFIIKSGIEMMSETLDDILGRRPDAELTKAIKHVLNEEPEVRGAFDLFLNDYGPDRYYASVHLELPDTMTVEEVDVLTRRVQAKVYKETGVILTGVGVYSYNTKNDEAAEIRNNVMKAVLSHDWALQVHGFFVDTQKREMRFDVVMSFDIDPKEGIETICKEVKALYPDYSVVAAPDVDLAD